MSSKRLSGLHVWLDYIASLHPTEIELGLDRVSRVAANLSLSKPAPLVVSVAGSNGKGSCVACIEAILQQLGLRTASYTSPHIQHYNERIKLSGVAVTDQQLCEAFAAVEDSRAGITLSYFEFGTLAAFWLIQKSAADVAVLEVGLGGRLDAVNIVDPDVSVISSIAIEHTAWLGDSLEEIGREKAGILRHSVPAIYGEENPPASILKVAGSLDARLYVQGKDFRYVLDSAASTWSWQGFSSVSGKIEFSNLPLSDIDPVNASTALQALAQLPVEVSRESVVRALSAARLAGRFERCRDRNTAIEVILDVAHNPAAAAFLARKLQCYRSGRKGFSRITAVIAMIADKDINGFYQALESCVDLWYIAQVSEPRCMPVEELAKRLRNCDQALSIRKFNELSSAYRAACEQADAGDLILVTGSFYTVGTIRNLTSATG
ncbi:MAG: bifunctional tetrahydrofolate synthase/dihydrofolate synthase [Gammaproteobacteria bacterium]|jgi:dihydrofolate synthase/folylpolyglutamate synthase|nr:bifunctional tetrahydrofolate synthase/dihydrofolate synthase [Gammaproteobacteria bacterium]MDP6097596.1 bifunctional tetrahydrofolate synthase/dihydrofolate synthase [Gammaproteobacteria bacterium]|tara:strand:+ start:57 stop:1361 length:1305 start_codon:yes stop_codon:yes gene_type:complete